MRLNSKNIFFFSPFIALNLEQLNIFMIIFIKTYVFIPSSNAFIIHTFYFYLAHLNSSVKVIHLILFLFNLKNQYEVDEIAYSLENAIMYFTMNKS